MTEVSSALDGLTGTMGNLAGQFLVFLPLLCVSAFAFWKENAVLFMIAAGIAMLTGLYTPDIISGYPNVGIAAGLMLIAFSLLCCGFAFRMMFWSEE